MVEYTPEEFRKLQSEAEARLMEMGRRTAPNPSTVPPMPSFVRTPYKVGETVNNTQTPVQSKGQTKSNTENLPTEKPRRQGFDILKMLNLKNIEMDNDRILIILVLLLISSGQTDEMLIFALVYLML